MPVAFPYTFYSYTLDGKEISFLRCVRSPGWRQLENKIRSSTNAPVMILQ